MSILIVVESMKKAIKIKDFLSNEIDKYICTASYGHIIDLKKKEMSIDFDNWIGIYENTNIKIISNIKKLAKGCKYILLAADDDDEGHFIAKSISDIIDPKIKKYRIIFREVTKQAILKAIEDKHDIDLNRVQCQIARRLADRIFGYKLSPLLWNKFDINTLSVGRCQSPILAMIVKRTDEINNPNHDIQYRIKGDFDNDLLNVLYKTESTIQIKELLTQINIIELYNLTYIINDYISHPRPPYITSTIQMDCSSIFNISSKKCMEILQLFYENSYITYHRTSSTSISNTFKNIAKNYIISNYGIEYSKPRNYIFSKNPATHECIRIVDINTIDINTDNKLHNDIYKLIWKRSVASQCSDSIYDQYDITLTFNSHVFFTTRKKLKFLGFLILDNTKIDLIPFILPNTLKLLKLYSEASIKQITLYNDNTIIKLMEKSGIGRPSTFATIITTLFNKGYVEYGKNPNIQIKCEEFHIKNDSPNKIMKKNVNLDLYTKGNNMILNTKIGKDIIIYLNQIATYIIQTETTQIMEKAIDLIADGKTDYKNMLNSFNIEIEKSIQLAKFIPSNVKNEPKIITTKYGKCILTSDKKFIGIEGYLQQMKKKTLTQKEIVFLIKLPIDFNNNTKIYNGKYGLYLKNVDNNIKISASELKLIKLQNNL